MRWRQKVRLTWKNKNLKKHPNLPGLPIPPIASLHLFIAPLPHTYNSSQVRYIHKTLWGKRPNRERTNRLKIESCTVKFSVWLLALACWTPFGCNAEDWACFGLDEIEVLSDRQGHQVRGLGIFAKSNASSGIAVNIVTPGFGSNLNLFATDHNSSSDRRITSDVTTQPNSLGVGVMSIGIVSINNLSLTLSNDTDGSLRTFSIQMSAFSSQAGGNAFGGVSSPIAF